MCRCATETTFECNVASAGGDRLARQVSCCGRYSISVARKSGKAYSHNPSICYSYELCTLIRRAGCMWRRVECARHHHCSDARLHIHTHAHTAGRRSTRFWSQGARDGSSGASRGDLLRRAADCPAGPSCARARSIGTSLLSSLHHRGVAPCRSGDGGHVTAWRLASEGADRPRQGQVCCHHLRHMDGFHQQLHLHLLEWPLPR